MTAAVATIGAYGLVLGDADRPAVSVARAPLYSVVQWLASAGRPRGSHTAFASSVALAVPPSSGHVVRALGAPTTTTVPEFLVPIAPVTDSSVADNLDALRETCAQALADEIAGWPDGASPEWRPAMNDPAGWRDDYVAAVQAAWATGQRYWVERRHALEREVNRIGAAVVTGTVPALLNSLHPRLQYRDGVLTFRSTCVGAVPLGTRRLVLVPVLAPTPRVVVSFERPDLAYIAYPALGTDATQPTAEDRLELVVGQLRALALRALVRPTTMQGLAAQIYCAASTATYHCDLLESAGLVVRERRGSSVWVMRTPAGDSLVDLLSSR